MRVLCIFIYYFNTLILVLYLQLSDSDELIKLGMKCQEDCHKDVIAKQTESLSYMRQKLNLVEDIPHS